MRKCKSENVKVDRYIQVITLTLLVASCAAAAPAQTVDPSTLTGKLVCGYQGWFACPGDGSSSSVGWFHWSRTRSNPPGPNNYAMDMWPDVSEAVDPGDLFTVPGLTLSDGSQAKLYSARTPLSVTQRHFKWMREVGIDGVFWQRFITDITSSSTKEHRDAVMNNIRSASQTHGRIWALEYDCNGASDSSLYNNLSNDWRYLIDTFHITGDPNYLHHDGKPVVIVWGLGFASINNTPATATNIINALHNDAVYGGNYVIGGVPAYWRSLSNDAQTDPAWTPVYHSFDALCPWTVMRYSDINGATNWKTRITGDLQDLTPLGIEYLPVVWPGYSFMNQGGTNTADRVNGDFYWAQVNADVGGGATSLFTAMFDEVNEGTAVYKVSDVTPTTGTWVTNNGYPHDLYLRLAGAARQSLSGDIPLTASGCPIDKICNGQQAWINLGEDVGSRLSHVQVADGDTTVVTMGGKLCRKNVNASQDYYFYFAVDDTFAYQGNPAVLGVSIDYYDTGTGTLKLQYDASGATYKNHAETISLTNTNKWLRKNWHITDAYFGNRQNNGADFRINGTSGLTYYVDKLYVSSSAPNPPAIQLSKSSVTYTILPGQTLPSETFTILNGGYNALNYTISSDAAWVSATPTTGTSTGEVDTGTITYQVQNLSAGPHTAAITVADPTASNSPQVIAITVNVRSLCDFDQDNDVDQADFGHLQACFTDLDPPTGDCTSADLNTDGHVDAADYDIFESCMNGPGQPPAPTCTR